MFEDKRKITLATVKSMIRKNPNLYIKVGSKFDGMVDMVTTVKDSFTPIDRTDNSDITLGIMGAWFVGGSRDSFYPYSDNHFDGVEVVNCCGKFTLAVKVA